MTEYGETRSSLARWARRVTLATIVAGLLVLGFFAVEHQNQWNAVTAIEDLGGSVHFDGSAPRLAGGRQGFSTRAGAMLGRQKPVWLFLEGRHVTDDAIEQSVLPLPTLTLVGLRNVAISDDALLRLQALPRLKALRCTRDGRNDRVLDALTEPVHLDVNQVEIEQACDYLADFARIPIRVDRGALTEAGIPNHMPLVTFLAPPHATLGTTLAGLLEPHDLGWYIDAGEIVVTTHSAALEKNLGRERIKQALPQLSTLQID